MPNFTIASPSVDALSTQSALANIIPHFTARESQQIMAQAVEEALISQQPLVVEAGTGTGKTFAYLVPILLSHQKAIISTATKNLQEQLFHKDIPILLKALRSAAVVTLLKGRANYLCKHRLELHYHDGRFVSRQVVNDLHKIKSWAGKTSEGDIAEVSDVAEDSQVWPYVTSTKDNCLGQECTFFSECHLVKARRAAQAADVVIVNHHLLFADMVIRDEQVGELLPNADVIVLDEAHQVAETASTFFGISLTGRQLLELAKDTETAYLREASDMSQLGEASARLQKATLDFRLALGEEPRRAPWQEVATKATVQEAITTLKTALDFISECLKVAAERGKELDNCWRRSVELSARLGIITTPASAEQVHWFETYTHSFAITITPMVVADTLREYRQSQPRAWIFTSATLAVKENFTHFTYHLGLDDARCLQLESPFDYQQQALFYVPRGMPDPQQHDYTSTVVESAVPVIEACGGRTFFLFTSHRALRLAAELLQGRLSYPLLIQGSMPKKHLLDQYRQLGNAVLLGSSSFWEGVDVRGEALSCVIIDKLPFAVPDEPILKARIQELKKQGRDPFNEYQLPKAVIALKQGFGRLIRDVEDKGVLMICDPRLIARPYGEVFLKSLPSMARTRSLVDVKGFFAKISDLVE